MCYSNCPFEIRGGERWGDCGSPKSQRSPTAHCCEESEDDEEEPEDEC